MRIFGHTICHMLKLVRNTLAYLGTIYDKDGKKIQWIFIPMLEMLQFNDSV